MNQKHIDKALSTLNGMASIVEAEMLVKGQYATEKVVDPERKGQLCKGRRYCAIGTLGVSYGLKPYDRGGNETHDWLSLTCIDKEFIDRRPALKLAFDALEAEAEAWANGSKSMAAAQVRRRLDRLTRNRYGYYAPDNFSKLEVLFETSHDFADTKRGRKVLLTIIEKAKARIVVDWEMAA